MSHQDSKKEHDKAHHEQNDSEYQRVVTEGGPDAWNLEDWTAVGGEPMNYDLINIWQIIHSDIFESSVLWLLAF